MTKDFPIEDVEREARARIALGWTIHQKFTCQKCNSRQTMAEPNKIFLDGICEECGHVTNIQATGCNYVAMFGTKS